MKKDIKRGYVKWTDEDGVRHKVPVEEYKEEEESKSFEDIKYGTEDLPPPSEHM